MKSKAMNKFVTFMIQETKFGVGVLKTREIVEYDKITPIPEAPDYIDGVINLRGSVVPVVNLSKKLFGQPTVKGENTSIVIVEPLIDEEQIKMGLIVDIVSDVLEIKDDKLEPPPRYGSKLKSEYLLHVANIENQFILILDIDKILSHIEIDKNLTMINDIPNETESKSQK